MKLSEILNEGFKGDWAILPATMTLYDKRTVDIIRAASEWTECTILVCHNEDDRICFVSSAGDAYKYYAGDVGKSYSTHHDQTGVSKGRYTIKNVVHFFDGEIKNKVNEVGLKEKASLSVFK